MKIIVDENIAFATEAFSQFGNVELVHGRKINNQIVRDADVLIVRSITKVSKELLQNTKVKFVGTATIGSDHIDKDYLSANNIIFTDAKGCNAFAVVEYFLAALFKLLSSENKNVKDLSIGIIGVGDIGSKIENVATALGMKTFLSDPPLKRKSNDPKFLEIEKLFQADIITLHTPLTYSGVDKTFHLLDYEKLSAMKNGTIVINTSRGEVVDNKVLNELIVEKQFKVILDVWENEPNINLELLQKVKIGTPHIAGYSLEGKTNGTKIIYDALSDFCNAEKIWEPILPDVIDNVIESNSISVAKILNQIFDRIYDVEQDSDNLKNIFSTESKNVAQHFDELRKIYPMRREFNNYFISMKKEDEEVKSILNAIRIKTIRK